MAEVKDVEAIKAKFYATAVGYEKIQLFRLINDEHDDSVIRKLINESYHIANEYVMQFNPHKFENIPEYVIEECVNTDTSVQCPDYRSVTSTGRSCGKFMLHKAIYNNRDLRMTVEGMLYRMRTGCPWSDLPEAFGSWSRVYKRFNAWPASGKWLKVFQALVA